MFLEEKAIEILKKVKEYFDYGSTNVGINKIAFAKYNAHLLKENSLDFINLAVLSSKESAEEKNQFAKSVEAAGHSKEIIKLVNDFLSGLIDHESFKEHIMQEAQKPLAPWTAKEAAGLRAVYAQLKNGEDERSSGQNIYKLDSKTSGIDLGEICIAALNSSIYGQANCASMAYLAYMLAFNDTPKETSIRLWRYKDEKYSINEELNFISLSTEDQDLIIIPWEDRCFSINASSDNLDQRIESHFSEQNPGYKQMTLKCIFYMDFSTLSDEHYGKYKQKIENNLVSILSNAKRIQMHREIEQDYYEFIKEHGSLQLKMSPYGPYRDFGLFPAKGVILAFNDPEKQSDLESQISKLKI